MQGLVTDLVNEELLACKAEAMGLDDNDMTIRRRLAQKLKFLVEDTSRLAEPIDAELRSFFEKNTARFETGATVSFIHIFFNPQMRSNTSQDATAALASLQKVGPTAQAAELGDRFLLDSELCDADEQTVSSILGEDFKKAVFAVNTCLKDPLTEDCASSFLCGTQFSAFLSGAVCCNSFLQLLATQCAWEANGSCQ